MSMTGDIISESEYSDFRVSYEKILQEVWLDEDLKHKADPLNEREREGVRLHLYNKLDLTVESFGESLEDVRGKRILVLGCGTRGHSEDVGRHIFEPWYCRALVKLGAFPVGVDIESQQDETFESHERDLSLPNQLDSATFPDKTFDGVEAKSLMNSPKLQTRLVSESGAHAKAYLDIMAWELAGQIKRVLKDGGKIIAVDSAIQEALDQLE
jgi:SAM-dependent methyltransferase